MRKSKKVFIGLLIVIALLLIALCALFIKLDGPEIFRKITNLQPETTVADAEYEDVINILDDLEDYEVKGINDLRGDGTLSSLLKTWATGTNEAQLMKRADVINFLLVGVDAGGTNADVIMLCTVNTTDKKIYLTSLMRDSYTYINGGGSDVYFKINSAYYYGGVDKLIETFQNDFKIKINHYATVDFNSFAEIVDIMGGINLDVNDYEAREINTVIKRENKGYTGADCPIGENVLLDGIHALTFCRIRHCYIDADVHRTLNQRKFVSAVIERSKDITLKQATSVISTLFSYLRTDLSSREVVGIARTAISDKWYNYEIVSSCYPEEGERLDYSGAAWVWIVDYPAAARKMQTMLYGESNITLSDDRVSAIDIMRSGG